MPIFPPKRKAQAKKDDPINGIIPSTSDTTAATTSSANTSSSAAPLSSRPSSFSSSSSRRSAASSSNGDARNEPPKLVFHCQLAHGSPTGLISGFSNVRELYQKIADCFEIPVTTILFCTLNTHKIDMSQLLGGQIGLNDFIFAHVKGQPKEIDIIKSESALGLTITDNGAGYAFIKRIKDGSVIDRLRTLIKVGDHIEKINEKSLVGTRHFEVAKMLKELPVGSTFTMRVVEPNALDFITEVIKNFVLTIFYNVFVDIEPAKRGRKTGDVKSGTKTLRFKADGRASVEDVDDTMVKAIDRINGLLETFMGINDSDLAQQIWDLAQNKKNPSDFAMAIDESEIGAFSFTDEFIFDLWAGIDDIKSGRIKEKESEDERL